MPDAPLVTVAACNASAVVSFQVPSSNGLPIQGYLVTAGQTQAFYASQPPFTLSNLSNQAYAVAVAASNAAGTGPLSASVSVTPYTVPDAPTLLSVAGCNASALVQVSPPANSNGSPVVGYLVTELVSHTSAFSTASPILLPGLCNQTYPLSVQASNAAGLGPASAACNATPFTVPGAPAISVVGCNVSATVACSTATSNGAPILGYLVSYALGGVTSNAFGDSPFQLSGLLSATYAVSAQASNVAGLGPASATCNVVPFDVPGALSPANVTVSVDAAHTFTIAWPNPSYTGNLPILGVTFVLSLDIPIDTVAYAYSSAPYTYSTSDLLEQVTYTVATTFSNALGLGPTATTTFNTAFTTPDAPTDLVAYGCNASAVVASFTVPDDNGTTIQGYLVSCKGSASALTRTFYPSLPPYTISNLSNGQYAIGVFASNAAGLGVPSVVYVTPFTAPGAPTITTVAGCNASALVFVTPPNSNNGSAVVGYLVTAARTGYSNAAFAASNVVLVTGLCNLAYGFTAQASNAAGLGPASGACNATPFTAPDAPTISVVACNASAVVSVTPPNSIGMPILQYLVTETWATNVTSQQVFTDPPPFTLTNLGNIQYAISVQATNAAGTGLPSATCNVTPFTAPGAPSIAYVAACNGSASVAFSAASNHGSPILQYLVTAFYPLTADSVAFTTAYGTASPVTVGSLTNTTYTFFVTASNAAGYGPSSTLSNATPFLPPGAPSLLSVTPCNASAVVAFSATSASNGAPIVGYLASATLGGVTSNAFGATSPLTVTGLTYGTYAFSVRASNAAGLGTASGTCNAAPFTAPGAAANVSLFITNQANYYYLNGSWTAPSSNGSPITSYSVVITNLAHTFSYNASGSLASSLDSFNVTPTLGTTPDSFVLTMYFTNAAGTGPTTTTNFSTVAGLPSAPAITGVASCNASAVVSFTTPSANGNPVVGYFVTASNAADYGTYPLYSNTSNWGMLGGGHEGWILVPTGTYGTSNPHVVFGSNSPVTVTGLSNLTYAFTVAASNALGVGSNSATCNVAIRTTPDAPTLSSATACNASALVAFSPPANNGGLAIAGYLVTATWVTSSTSSTFGPYFNFYGGSGDVIVTVTGFGSYTTYETVWAGSTCNIYATTYYTSNVTAFGASNPILVPGLWNTQFAFAVQASNAYGLGPASVAACNATPYTVPAAPSVSAVGSNASAVVSFSAPAANGKPIVGYLITDAWTDASGNGASNAAFFATSPPLLLTGLTSFTYSLSVQASNAAGLGPAGTATATPYVAPGAPVLSVAASNASAVVSIASLSSNGNAILGYLVTDAWTDASGNHSNVAYYPPSLPLVVSGLSNLAYAFTVAASNAAGLGPNSAACNATPYLQPGAPTIASVAACNASAYVWVSPPASSNGSPVVGYAAWFTSNAWATSNVAYGAASPLVVAGLCNLTYAVAVAASNAAGYGPWSAACNVTPYLVPGAPSITGVAACNASALVAFTAPGSNGSPIVGYLVSGTLNGVASNAFGATSPLLVTGLSNASYAFAVRASNAAGLGPASGACNATPFTVPGSATSLSVVSISAGLVATITWANPVNTGGLAITSYPYLLTDGATSNTGSVATKSFTSLALNPNAAYLFSVTCCNAAGAGPSSTVLFNTTYGVPGAPTITSAVASNASAIVSFTTPNNNGNPIIGYLVTDTWASSNSNATFTTANTITVTGLGNLAYAFTVAACNAAGFGSNSAACNVTPYLVPGAPVLTSAVGCNASALVYLTAPSSNGSAIVGYLVTDVWASSNSNAAFGASSPVLVTGLSNLTYTFTAQASNAAGLGPASVAACNATPFTVPGAPQFTAVVASNASTIVSLSIPSSNGLSIAGYLVTDAWTDASGNTQSNAHFGASNTITITGLSNLTYTFTARASNAAGLGPAGAACNATPYTVPGAPGIALVASNASAILSITSLTSNGRPILGYVITDTWFGSNTVVTYSTATPPITLTGLTNVVTYSVKVAASNAAGLGPVSATCNVVPHLPPGIPTSLVLTPGCNAITATFTAPTYVPANSNGATGYLATAFYNSASNTVFGTASPLVIPAAAGSAGANWTVVVSACNSSGYGPGAVNSNVTPYTTPGNDANITSVSAGNQSISVTLSQANGFYTNGASTILGCLVTASSNSVNYSAYAPYAASSTVTISNLPVDNESDQYTVSWASSNAAGLGTVQTYSGTFSPYGPPSQPINLVYNTSTNTVYWMILYAGGGRYNYTVTTYVTLYTGSTVLASTTSSTGYDCNYGFVFPAYSNLNGGYGAFVGTYTYSFVGATAYKLVVYATNTSAPIGYYSPLSTCFLTGGSSSVSNVYGTTPYIIAPGAPSIGTVTSSNGGLLVAFSAPSDNGGSAILSYSVWAFVTTTPGTRLGTTAATSSPVQITGLSPNANNYNVGVMASNVAGFGASNVTSLPYYMAYVVYAAPSTPSLSYVYSTGIGTLSWSGSYSGAPNNALYYTVTVTTGGSTVLSMVLNSPFYSGYTTTLNTTYTVTATAYNQYGGYSATSNTWTFTATTTNQSH